MRHHSIIKIHKFTEGVMMTGLSASKLRITLAQQARRSKIWHVILWHRLVAHIVIIWMQIEGDHTDRQIGRHRHRSEFWGFHAGTLGPGLHSQTSEAVEVFNLVHIYKYLCVCVCIYTFICIYRERESVCVCFNTSTFIMSTLVHQGRRCASTLSAWGH